MTLTPQEIIGTLSVLISLVTYAIYIRSIVSGLTRPHTYTWIVFSMLVIIGFMAQLHENTGAGAWALGLSVCGNILILLLSLKYGESHITKSDKIALGLSLFAVVPWLVTHDPLGSVILISIINVIGFFPTFRKTWYKPYSEKIFTYFLGSAPLILSLMVMDNINVTTTLYPTVIILSNTSFAFFCFWRRGALKTNTV